MEVLDECSEELSNRQVLDLVKNYTSKKQKNLATILYETTSYLESSPAASSSTQQLAKFLDMLKEKQYELSKMEKIQLVNLKPQNETELILTIDNIEEKLNEEQRVELLEMIKNVLNKQDPEDEEDKLEPQNKKLKI